MKRTIWFERKFQQLSDTGLLPGIIERLEGTPVRLEAKLDTMDKRLLTIRSGDKWSVKKEIGHLNDLEPLWFERVKQIRSGVANLAAADLSNQKTHQADHDDQPVTALLAAFKRSRQQLISELRSLKEEDLNKSSLHPRLQTPMSVLELAYFVAEHDDHHLAQITALNEDLAEQGNQ